MTIHTASEEPDLAESSWSKDSTPAALWDRESTKRAVDQLFLAVKQYRRTSSYGQLLRFIAQFRYYSPYNALLLHTQKPGATHVAPADRWKRNYGRLIKPNARPLLILQPRGACHVCV